MPSDESPRFEAASRQFLNSELSLCATLLDSAEWHYRRRQRDRGDDIIAKVKRACAVIEARLADAEDRGWDVTTVQQRYATIHHRLLTVLDHVRDIV